MNIRIQVRDNVLVLQQETEVDMLAFSIPTGEWVDIPVVNEAGEEIPLTLGHFLSAEIVERGGR